MKAKIAIPVIFIAILIITGAGYKWFPISQREVSTYVGNNGPKPASSLGNSATPRQDRQDRTLEFLELETRFGKSQTKFAHHVSMEFLGFIEKMVESGHKELTDEELKQHLGQYPDALSLSPEQLASARKMARVYRVREEDELREIVAGYRAKPDALMELMLAGDACAHGKLSEDEYRRNAGNFPQEFQKHFEELAGVKRSFTDPELCKEFETLLASEQKQKFRSMIAERDHEILENEKNGVVTEFDLDSPSPFLLGGSPTRLDKLDKAISGMSKMVEGMQALRDVD